MPPIRNTGFIPKQAVEETPQDPFFILGIIFVVIAVVVSLASYGVGMYYESDNESIKSNIKSVTTNFNEKTIIEMLNFYTKTIAVNGVLKQHTYPNSIFYTLESAVEDTVYFKKFSFTSRDEKGYEVSITGVAPNYKSVAKQMDILKGEQFKTIFSNVDLKSISSDQYGSLSFDITFNANVSNQIKQSIIRSSQTQNQEVPSTSNAAYNSNVIPPSNLIPTPSATTTTSNSNTKSKASTTTNTTATSSTVKTVPNPISL